MSAGQKGFNLFWQIIRFSVFLPLLTKCSLRTGQVVQRISLSFLSFLLIRSRTYPKCLLFQSLKTSLLVKVIYSRIRFAGQSCLWSCQHQLDRLITNQRARQRKHDFRVVSTSSHSISRISTSLSFQQAGRFLSTVSGNHHQFTSIMLKLHSVYVQMIEAYSK